MTKNLLKTHITLQKGAKLVINECIAQKIEDRGREKGD